MFVAFEKGGLLRKLAPLFVLLCLICPDCVFFPFKKLSFLTFTVF